MSVPMTKEQLSAMAAPWPECKWTLPEGVSVWRHRTLDTIVTFWNESARRATSVILSRFNPDDIRLLDL